MRSPTLTSDRTWKDEQDADGGATVSMWSYRVDGLTYFAFPFDPSEDGLDTRTRAVNWLNRYHLILMREHLVLESLSRGFSPLRQAFGDPLRALMVSVGFILLIVHLLLMAEPYIRRRQFLADGEFDADAAKL